MTSRFYICLPVSRALSTCVSLSLARPLPLRVSPIPNALCELSSRSRTLNSKPKRGLFPFFMCISSYPSHPPSLYLAHRIQPLRPRSSPYDKIPFRASCSPPRCRRLRTNIRCRTVEPSVGGWGRVMVHPSFLFQTIKRRAANRAPNQSS